MFTLIRLGLTPRCALESGNSEARIIKILELIPACRYGIHDISMQSLDLATQLPRFNMPFELGLFMGCKHYSSDGEQASKEFLVLDSNPHRFRASLSDFAGNDIACHSASPEETVRIIRNWIADLRAQITYGGVKLQSEFRAFEAALPTLAADFAQRADQITYNDLCHLIRIWILLALPQA